MSVPIIAGQPLHLWLGLLLLVLLVLQVITGKRWLKVPFAWHRVNGIVIVLIALLHAAIGLGLRFLGFTAN